MRQHRFDETAVQNSVVGGRRPQSVVLDEVHRELPGVEGGPQPTATAPLIGRVVKIAVFVVSPGNYVAFVDRFFEGLEQCGRITRFEIDSQSLGP